MRARLQKALGALVEERGGALWAVPATERELIDVVHIVSDQRARLGRDLHLSRERLTTLRAVEPLGMTVEVGAGVTLKALEAHLLGAGLSLGPLSPSAWELTVAQLLEGPLAGLRAISGGRLEPVAAQISGVLSDGRRLTTLPGPRSATGPDLAALFLGTNGRAALATSAILRAFPAPERRARLVASLPSAAPAVAALTQALSDGCWASSVVARSHGARCHLEVSWAGTVGGVERDRAVLVSAVERAGGVVTTADEPPGEASPPPRLERETTWDEVEGALAKGRSLELYRLSLASVVVVGELDVAPAVQAQRSAAILLALDPRQTLGGAA